MFARLYKAIWMFPEFRGRARLAEIFRRRFLSPRPVRIAGDLSMILDVNEYTQADLLVKGGVEPLTMALIQRLLRPGDSYVDVGAHVGFHTLVARRYIGPTGRVVAIEPQPANCAKILENWKCNGFENIVVIVALAGGQSSVCSLHEQFARDRSRLSVACDPVNDEPQIFEVPVYTLEEVIRRHNLESIRLLKVDVEGAEYEVLGGLGRETARVEHCIVEVLPEALAAARTPPILDWLRSAGFELRSVTGENWNPERPLPENNLWAARDGDV